LASTSTSTKRTQPDRKKVKTVEWNKYYYRMLFLDAFSKLNGGKEA